MRGIRKNGFCLVCIEPDDISAGDRESTTDEAAAVMKRNGIDCLKSFPVADETEGFRIL